MDDESFISDPSTPGDPNPDDEYPSREGDTRRAPSPMRRGSPRSERQGRRVDRNNIGPGHIDFDDDEQYYPRGPRRRSTSPRMGHPEYDPSEQPPQNEGYRQRQPEFWPYETPFRYRAGSRGMYPPPPWTTNGYQHDSERNRRDLERHEMRDELNFARILREMDRRSNNPHGQEKHNMEGLASDKVNINVGGDGGNGGNLAALIAAMNGGGGRSDGSTNAALMALLMGGMGRDRDRCDNDGFGLGGGGIGALVLLALLGGGLGGGFGRGDHVNVDCGSRRGGRDFDGDPFVLSKLGSIEGAIPLAASQIQNGILESTAGITNTINQVGLAQLAATAGVKDSVQNSATAILQNASANTQSVLGAICNLSSKLDHNTITDLQRQLGVAQAAIADERHERRSRDVEVNVTQQVNQQQQQQQFQIQFDSLRRGLDCLLGQFQNVRQAQDIVNLGTMVASGTQASTNTQVR